MNNSFGESFEFPTCFILYQVKSTHDLELSSVLRVQPFISSASNLNVDRTLHNRVSK